MVFWRGAMGGEEDQKMTKHRVGLVNEHGCLLMTWKHHTGLGQLMP